MARETGVQSQVESYERLKNGTFERNLNVVHFFHESVKPWIATQIWPDLCFNVI